MLEALLKEVAVLKRLIDGKCSVFLVLARSATNVFLSFRRTHYAVLYPAIKKLVTDANLECSEASNSRRWTTCISPL